MLLFDLSWCAAGRLSASETDRTAEEDFDAAGTPAQWNQGTWRCDEKTGALGRRSTGLACKKAAQVTRLDNGSVGLVEKIKGQAFALDKSLRSHDGDGLGLKRRWHSRNACCQLV